MEQRQIPPEAEELIRRFASVEPPEEASRLLANSLNKTVAALHRLARDRAAARKGQPDWPAWARLANASRNALLAASMCREIANSMVQSPAVADENRPGEQST